MGPKRSEMKKHPLTVNKSNAWTQGQIQIFFFLIIRWVGVFLFSQKANFNM